MSSWNNSKIIIFNLKKLCQVGTISRNLQDSETPSFMYDELYRDFVRLNELLLQNECAVHLTNVNQYYFE